MRVAPLACLAAALLLTAAGARAQESEVVRRGYTFVKSSLTIEVVADAPGRLHLIRGSTGEIGVTARAENGFAGSGLAGRERDELTLTAVGADRVEYLVVVPEDVWVRVRLPDRIPAKSIGSFEEKATFEWDAPGEQAPADVGAAPAGESGAAYTSATAPRRIIVRNPSLARTLTVRWEGDRFSVETGRPIRVTPGDPEVIELRMTGAPRDVTIILPRGTNDFTLDVGTDTALRVAGGRAAVLCSPVMEQHLSDGRRWFTFTPDDGRLTCDPPVRPGRKTRKSR